MADGARIVKCLGETHGERFALYHGDCVEVLSQLPSACIDLSVYSPPFADLFVYSDSDADMGNCESPEAFIEQYEFLCRELLRVTTPGRLAAVHCSDLPLQKWKDGVIGLRDFSGMLIGAHDRNGWVLHDRVTIWKDPVVEMQRTKALGLLHKQLLKDSTRSRTGIPDQLLVFRAPGDNPRPVSHSSADFPVTQWQEWASPVWTTVDQGDVLETRSEKVPGDEKHICPLQIDVIERAVRLWSNPGDTVASPFSGIGSEGVVALRLGRRFIGVELKLEYFQRNGQHLDGADRQMSLPNA